MRKRLLFIFTCLAMSIFPGLLFGQAAQVGTVMGEVTDQTGAALPGVTVQLVSQERGVSRTFMTDMNGRFMFAQVPLGMYRVVSTLSGFQTQSISNNVVEAQKTTRLNVSMRLAAASEQITVTGDVPIVDPTNTTTTTRLSTKEFEKLPMGRSYQTLFGIAPGVVGTGNANVHGALTSNNLFMFDGIDVTDATTGTFGSNLNFEAIQEVNIYTAGISAEYGRATGGIINVITKSGTNQFEGSAKYIITNDELDQQNRTKSEVTGASLARPKFDKIQPRYAFTFGGPIIRDRAWFFANNEFWDFTTAARQTAVTLENFQQSTTNDFRTARLTWQITPNHNIFGKYNSSPTSGFIVDYWGTNAETFAMTSQDQTAEQLTVQWSGVFSPRLSAEAFVGSNEEWIGVSPYRVSPLHGGAPHTNLADNRVYNGATFEGMVDRPRDQATAAVTYFADLWSNSHNFKVGLDYQTFDSTSEFHYPTNTRYFDSSFDPVARTFVPLRRRNYDPLGASTSSGTIRSLYARDKFEIGERMYFEVGLRYEQQQGDSDVGLLVVDASALAPRLSASFDLRGDGKSIVLGTAGRLYQFIIQDVADRFGEIPQQTNYDNYTWDAARNDYVFTNRFQAGATSFVRNTNLNPVHLDELTLGYQQQLGTNMAAGIRGIFREWGDLIDDVFAFNPNGTFSRQLVNYDLAQREYRAIELTFEKRFSNRWNALASYTLAETEGNQFETWASSLGNWVDATCRSVGDPSIGNNGIIPCREVNEGRNRLGNPASHRPHNVKAQGAYTQPIGPVNLTLGTNSEWISGTRFTKNSSVEVLNPAGQPSGQFATYFYEKLGSDTLDGTWYVDTSLEATFKVFRDVELGVKGEAFNLTDQQEKIGVGATTWCANTVNPSAACTTARARYGLATARGNFQLPRTYRLTALIRF